MAGMQLRTAVSAGASFNPGLPIAAESPSSNRAATITQQAFGVSATSSTGPRTAGLGSVAVGTLALGALILIWWSLPR